MFLLNIKKTEQKKFLYLFYCFVLFARFSAANSIYCHFFFFLYNYFYYCYCGIFVFIFRFWDQLWINNKNLKKKQLTSLIIINLQPCIPYFFFDLILFATTFLSFEFESNKGERESESKSSREFIFYYEILSISVSLIDLRNIIKFEIWKQVIKN